MKPNKQEREQIINNLDKLYTPVYLRCDGYLVSAGLMRSRRNRLKIVVYVDGVIQLMMVGVFKAAEEMSEEARRFWFPSRCSVMNSKELKVWEKLIGKRKCKKRGYYDKRIVPTPEWNSARSLVRHLIKHNEDIELIDYATYQAELKTRKAAQSTEQQRGD